MKFINKVITDREVEQVGLFKIKFIAFSDATENKNRVFGRFTRTSSKSTARCQCLSLQHCSSIQPFFGIYFQNLIPLVDVNNHKELLRLHLLAEPCVRRCYPQNHPGIAFHLRWYFLVTWRNICRSIGLFYSGLRDYPTGLKYIQEAVDILRFTLDDDHLMTKETIDILEETRELSGEKLKEKSDENMVTNIFTKT